MTTYRININDIRNPWFRGLVVFASVVILVVSVGCAFLVTGAMVLLSLVLHPILTTVLGRKGMWREKGGKMILALDKEAFQK